MMRFILAVTLGLVGGVTSVTAQQGRIGASDLDSAGGIAAQAGRRASFACPAINPAQVAGVEIWGTDVYVADSPICIAAIHAGALQPGQAGSV